MTELTVRGFIESLADSSPGDKILEIAIVAEDMARVLDKALLPEHVGEFMQCLYNIQKSVLAMNTPKEQ